MDGRAAEAVAWAFLKVGGEKKGCSTEGETSGYGSEFTAAA